MSLSALQFVDLHLGADFSALTQVAGKPNPWEPGEEFAEEVGRLREACRKTTQESGETEFSLDWDGCQYRVAVFREARGKDLFVLRKCQVKIRNLSVLGFGSKFFDLVVKPNASGLVLVVGPMANGKTNTAASIAAARADQLGGMGMAIEDPPETPLTGRVGRGRFVQVWARARTGGYRGAIQRAMRSGADQLYLGEVRDDVTAHEVIQASANGTFCVGTMHAKGIAEALQRLEGRADGGGRGSSIRELIAAGVLAVVYQELVRTNGAEGRVSVMPKHKVLIVGDDAAIRAKLRYGDWIGIEHDAHRQTEQRAWTTPEVEL